MQVLAQAKPIQEMNAFLGILILLAIQASPHACAGYLGRELIEKADRFFSKLAFDAIHSLIISYKNIY